MIDRLTIYITVGLVGVAGCAALALFWDKKIVTDHSSVSVGLLGLTFVLGSVDCMTTVLFYPVAERFSDKYVTALLVGEALTGVIASLMATAQQSGVNLYAGESLRFSVEIYFLTFAGLMLLSATAFAFIDHAKGDGLCHRKSAKSPDAVESESLSESLVPVAMSEHAAKRGCRVGCMHITIFTAQAVLAFIENGVLVTLLPLSLKPFQHSDLLISVANKVSMGGAGIVSIIAYLLPRPPRIDFRFGCGSTCRHQLFWVVMYVLAIVTATWMVWSSTQPAVQVGGNTSFTGNTSFFYRQPQRSYGRVGRSVEHVRTRVGHSRRVYCHRVQVDCHIRENYSVSSVSFKRKQVTPIAQTK